MLSEEAKEVCKALRRMSHRHSTYDVFRGFMELSFTTLAKASAATVEDAEALEARYMEEVGRWDPDHVRALPEVLARVMQGYSRIDDCRDVLGEVAGELGVLNPDQGQFFTPMTVCRMMAEMHMDGIEGAIKARGFATVSEPAAGAGAMVLALAHRVRARGHDPARCLWVEATELNPMTYQMLFVALTCSGVAARVTQGNTLSGEVRDRRITVAAHPFWAKHGDPFKKRPRVRTRKKQPRRRVRPPQT